MTPLIGRTLAHYRITAAIGAGGMGEVYRATDTKLGRDVALEVLPAEMAASRERLERFRREAKALAALDHQGVVSVYSVEEADGVHFLTMQLAEGQPLDRVVPEGGLTAAQILEIAAGLAEALAAAHEKGIVHRDLKPANVMVTTDGRVKVLDFGLAKITGAEHATGPDSAMSTDVHTRDGVVIGTLPYMSPGVCSRWSRCWRAAWPHPHGAHQPDPRGRGLRTRPRGARDRGGAAGRVGGRTPRRGLRRVHRAPLEGHGGRRSSRGRAPTQPRLGPRLAGNGPQPAPEARRGCALLRAGAGGRSARVLHEGWLLGALGEIDAAFDGLARAEEQNQLWLYYSGLPGFDPLRADPRWSALLARLGLPFEGSS